MAFVFPTFTCEIAFGYAPGSASPVWTDVSSYLRRFHITRGRQYEINQFQAGTATVTLRNLDRSFDPLYTSSAYYPNIVPLVPIRVKATFGGTTYTLFTGYVERWPQNREGPNYAETVLPCVDGFELLSLAILPGASYPSETTGARIGRVLDAISWPSSARNIATGQTSPPAYTFTTGDGVIALSHIQDCETAEIGQFFMDGSGTATFFDRHTSLGSTSLGTFTDEPSTDTGDIGYAAITATLDKDLIINDAIGTRISQGGADSPVTQEAMDSTSITDYFQRSQNYTNLLIPTDTETLSNMQSRVVQYATPALRIEDVTITPGDNDSAWTQVLARDIGDRITVREHPPGGGAAISQDSFIQQYDLTVDTHASTASQTWGLIGAAVLQGTEFVLNDTANAVLDTSPVGY